MAKEKTKDTRKENQGVAGYVAKDITVLKGLEPVRQRPAMYIGDVAVRGLHHLVYEVVDNSIDEALAGYARNIDVSINQNGSVTVIDDGRGIPTDIHPEEKRSALEVVMTVLHAGGKFDKNTYKVSGGLHGVGVSCVNALSKKMLVEVYKEGKVYEMEFGKGAPKNELKVTGKTEKRGTKVSFWPDDSIMKAPEVEYETLAKRFRELAFLNPGIEITLRDERDSARDDVSFMYQGGLRSFVEYLNENKGTLFPKPI